jgi:hypothetical protein
MLGYFIGGLEKRWYGMLSIGPIRELSANVWEVRAVRTRGGQVALSLNLIIAIFIVGSLGFVCYELSRILLAREQLKHCLELSALAGGASMASTSQTGQTARDNAVLVAMNILRMNSILGQPMTNSVVQATSISGMTPGNGQISAYFEFDDPITKQPVAAGVDSNVLRVYGAYAYPLFSGGFGSIGVSVYTVMAEATAGLPAIDVEIVYNNDSSSDDQTPVTAVRRYWDPTVPAIAYWIPTSGGTAEGPIYSVVCPGLIGSEVNGIPPQNLDAAGDPRTSSCPREFSEVGTQGNTVPLRGITEAGDPPGDAPPGTGGLGLGGMSPGPGYGGAAGANPGNNSSGLGNVASKPPSHLVEELLNDIDRVHLEQPAQAWFTRLYDQGSGSYNPWGADQTMFTDIVVNLDGNNHFAGYRPPGGSPFAGHPFRNLGYLVEASRGNLENGGVAPNVHTDVPMDTDSKPGYMQAYQCLAYQNLQPKNTAERAIQSFMTKMMQSADCHFGFVAYNNRAGTSATDFDSDWKVSWAYQNAGKVNYLLPQIPLQTGANNYATVNAVLTPPNTAGTFAGFMAPNGGSCLAAGLKRAYEDLMGTNSRPGAMKTIVVYTDKVPTRDLLGNQYPNPGANGPALSDAINVAQNCNTNGIPIFMVTLDQTGQMAPYLNTQFSDTAPGGVVSTAGHGGVLYVDAWVNAATNYGTLVGKFNNVVRQLINLVQESNLTSSAAAAS